MGKSGEKLCFVTGQGGGISLDIGVWSHRREKGSQSGLNLGKWRCVCLAEKKLGLCLF